MHKTCLFIIYIKFLGQDVIEFLEFVAFRFNNGTTMGE